MSGHHPNYGILKIGQNNEKNLGDLRRLAVAQAPVKDHQQTLVEKKSQGIIIIKIIIIMHSLRKKYQVQGNIRSGHY